MMASKKIVAALVAGGLLVSGAAQATLVDRGGGLIYDDVLNVTWLQDANYAMTSGYDADGKMTWDAAKAWAADLTFGGYGDWRLPTTDPIDEQRGFNYGGTFFGPKDIGYDNTSANSELAYMYYVNLANESHESRCGGTGQLPCSLFAPQTGPFINVQWSQYWSGSAILSTAPSVYRGDAWTFDFISGYQAPYKQGISFSAWAVRDGDVAASVPEPGTWLLLGIGLAALGATRRRG